MLCVLACYIYVVCFDVTVQCILTWSFVYFSDRFFLFLCDKPRLLFCFGVVFEIFWRGHYLCLCFGVSLFTLCVLICLTVYFDVVINLISLTDCPLFLCDNFP